MLIATDAFFLGSAFLHRGQEHAGDFSQWCGENDNEVFEFDRRREKREREMVRATVARMRTMEKEAGHVQEATIWAEKKKEKPFVAIRNLLMGFSWAVHLAANTLRFCLFRSWYSP